MLFCSQALLNFLIIARLKNKKNLKEIHLKAIFALIELKTDQDMKEVILEIRALRTEIATLEKLVWGLLYSFAITIVTTIIIAIVNKFF